MTRFQIIGGGIIGLCMAYELVRRGESVRVLEAERQIAQKTSFANAGMVHASLSDPWNRPGVGKDIMRAFFGRASSMKLKLGTVPSLGFWGIQFLYNSNKKRHEQATKHVYDLGRLSLKTYEKWREELKPDDDFTNKGLIKIFRTQKDFNAARKHGEILAKYGMDYRVFSSNDLVKKEPSLTPIKDKIIGAIYYPDDYKADAYKFCLALEQAIKKQNGEIITNTKITKLLQSDKKIIGVLSDDKEYMADNTIIAAGVWSNQLLTPLGIKLPIRPIKGYSLHFDKNYFRHELPQLPIVDDSLHCAITPLSGGLRIAGTAEICGLDDRLDEKSIRPIFNMFKEIYPDLAAGLKLQNARHWCGFRPVTSTGEPLIGKLKDGLYINSGHAHMGWTLGAGSAKLLADIMQESTA